MAEIKELRKQAMRRRQLAPASSGRKGSTKAGRTSGIRIGEDKGRTSIDDATGVAATSRGDGKEASAVEVDHPEAWEWYLKAAAIG